MSIKGEYKMADKNTSTTVNTTSIKETGADKVIDKTTGLVEVINESISEGISSQLESVDTIVEKQLARADKLKADEIKAQVALGLDEAVTARTAKLDERLEKSRYNLNEAKVKVGQKDREIEILRHQHEKSQEVIAELQGDVESAKTKANAFKADAKTAKDEVVKLELKIDEKNRVISKLEGNVYATAKSAQAQIDLAVSQAELAAQADKMADEIEIAKLTLKVQELEGQVEFMAEFIESNMKAGFMKKVRFLFGK